MTDHIKTHRTLSWRDLALIVIVTFACAVMLKAFVVEAYRIPSASMENTLMTGDMILVDKLAYGIRLPSIIPFVPVSLSPSYVLPFHLIRRGDVIVFEMGQSDPDNGVYNRVTYVKRVIGIPGDTIRIHESRVFVNDREMIPPPTMARPNFEHTSFSPSIFPDGEGFTEWEYGPLYVPGRGDEVRLTAGSISTWRHIIEREGHRVDLTERGDVMIDGIVQQTYRLTKDYFFVLGDHRENSVDSRMWGFVCEDDIVGEALMVYWSSAPESSMTNKTSAFRRVRWDRVATLIR